MLLAAQFSASAADFAVLKNGSSIAFVRKEEIGPVTRLYVPGGHMDIPTADIASFDKDDSPVVDLPLSPQPEPANAATAIASAPSAEASPAVAPPAPNAAATRNEIDEYVRESASKHQLDPDFVASVIKAESNFNPHAISRRGARGLMQLMPQTAAQLGLANAFDPRANVEAGTAHLSALLDQYNNDPIKALAAYNAGAHRVKQYHGVPPYRETRAYVAKIVRDFNAKKRAQMKAAAMTQKAAATPDKTSPVPAGKKPQKSQPQQASMARIAKPA